MDDETYLRRRAVTAARMAENSGTSRARAIHEELQRAYIQRAEALRRDPQSAR